MATSPFASLVGDILTELKGFSLPIDFFELDYLDLDKYGDPGDFGFDPPSLQQIFQPQQNQTASRCAQFLLDREKERFIQSLPLTGFQSIEFNESASRNVPVTVSTVSDLREPSLISEGDSGSSSSQTCQGDFKSTTSQEPPSKRVCRLAPEKGKGQSNAPYGTPKKPVKKSGRKGGKGRKTCNATPDEKRRESLEKNRIAAAKCREKKRGETEQMQQESQEKAVQNRILKRQILSLKREITEMTTVLFGHAYCDGCESPKDIQKHLSTFATESFPVPESVSPVEMDREYGDFAMIHVNGPMTSKR